MEYSLLDNRNNVRIDTTIRDVTCSWDGSTIEKDTHALIISVEQDGMPYAAWVRISNIEALHDALSSFQPASGNAGAILSPSEQVVFDYVSDNINCAVCDDMITRGDRVLFFQEALSAVCIHADCSTTLTDALDSIWEETGAVIPSLL